jgi:hypothetical protein
MEDMEAVGSKMQQEILICQCGSLEHQFSFVWWEDKDLDSEVYMECHLTPLPFWQRLKNGIKYIFGHRSVYGDFDDVILRKEDAHKLERIVEFLKK